MPKRIPKDYDQFISNLINSSIWNTPNVSEQPSIKLSRWSVMEVQTGDHHLVGHNMNDDEGRVSTPITDFNVATREVTTRSGRVYQLFGAPGYDSDGSWVWHVWSKQNGLIGKDITDQYVVKIAGVVL